MESSKLARATTQQRCAILENLYHILMV